MQKCFGIQGRELEGHEVTTGEGQGWRMETRLILPRASFAGTCEFMLQCVEMGIAKPLYLWCFYWQGSGSAIQF